MVQVRIIAVVANVFSLSEFLIGEEDEEELNYKLGEVEDVDPANIAGLFVFDDVLVELLDNLHVEVCNVGCLSHFRIGLKASEKGVEEFDQIQQQLDLLRKDFSS